MIADLKTHDSDVYTLQNNILVRVNKNVTLPHQVYLPKSLFPFALAYFHYKTHSGVKKMLLLLKLNYFWPGMQSDVAEFVRGCILCSCAKHTNIGPNAIGTLSIVMGPRVVWQIDIVQGLPTNKGYTSFLNCVDMYCTRVAHFLFRFLPKNPNKLLCVWKIIYLNLSVYRKSCLPIMQAIWLDLQWLNF